MIPTGEIRAVEGTPFDFRTLRRIGDRIDGGDAQAPACRRIRPQFCSERRGLQEICGARRRKDGQGDVCVYRHAGSAAVYGKFCSGRPCGGRWTEICKQKRSLPETQFFPNAVNTEGFEKPIVKAGERYEHVTAYRFGLV